MSWLSDFLFTDFEHNSLSARYIWRDQRKDVAQGTFDQFSIPRATEGDPWPVVYGTVKLTSPLVIWSGGFRASPIKKTVSNGILSKRKAIVNWEYHVGMQLGLCLGPGTRVRRVFCSDDEIYSGTVNHGDTFQINKLDLFGGFESGGGLFGDVTFHDGRFDQMQDAYLVAQVGAGVPAYTGISYLVFKDFYWGTSTEIRPLQVEVDRFVNTLGLPDDKHIMSNGKDMNPAAIIYDLMTTDWGGAGTPTAQIDDTTFVDAGLTLYDEDAFMSVVISKGAKLSDTLKPLLDQINATMYQDPATGKIKLKLIRDDYDADTLPLLTVSKLSEVKNYTKNLWGDTINQVRVMFTSRDAGYKDSVPAIWQDFGNISQQGRIKTATVTFPGVFDAVTAAGLAAREGAQLSIPLFGAQLTVNRAAGQSLRPGDPFRLSIPDLGVTNLIMRAAEVDLGTLESGAVGLTAAQDLFGSGVVTFSAPPPTEWTPPSVDPAAITVRSVFAIPLYFATQLGTALVGDKALVWSLARQPSSASLYYDARGSSDNFTSSDFVDAPTVGYAGAAQLVGSYLATVAADDGLDDGATGLTIDNLDGAYVPTSATDTQIKTLGANLMRIDDEIMAYTTVVDNGDGSYKLTGIRRALLDTTFATHADNAPVFFLSDASGIGTQEWAGTVSTYYKLIDWTNNGSFDEGSQATDTLAISQRTYRPEPPDYITVNGTRGGDAVTSTANTISFKARSRLRTALTYYNEADDTPEAGVTYKLRWRENGGAYTTVEPFTSGSTITNGSVAGTLDLELSSKRDGVYSWTVETASVILRDGLVLSDTGKYLLTDTGKRLKHG